MAAGPGRAGREGAGRRVVALPAAASQERVDLRVVRLREQGARIALGEHRMGLGVQVNRVVGDGEDAGQLVGDGDHGAVEARPYREDQVVEQSGADRVQPRRGLVQKQDVRVERHRARETRPLLHAAADLRRVKVLEAAEPDQRELERGDLADLRGGEIGELAERQADILRECHRAPEGSALVENAEPARHELALLVVGAPERLLVEEDVALGGPEQSDQVPQERALAAAAGAHDDENLAASHGEVQIVLDDEIAVGHGQVHDADAGRISCGRTARTPEARTQ